MSIFHDILPKEYADRFDEVFDSSLNYMDIRMIELYEDGRRDESLSEDQKKIIIDCYTAYKEAVFEVPCTRLIDMYKDKKFNFDKYFKRGKKSSFLLDDISMIINRMGYGFDYISIPTLVTKIMSDFNYPNFKEEIDNSPYRFHHGIYFMILLSRYARVRPLTDYAGMWFVCIIIQRLILFQHPTKEVLDKCSKELGIQITNLFLLLRSIEEHSSLRKLLYVKDLASAMSDAIDREDRAYQLGLYNPYEPAV